MKQPFLLLRTRIFFAMIILVFISFLLIGVSTSFQISEVYPNPFNPSTNIEFSVNQNAKIDLSIYNLNGQLVEVILNDFIYPGTYSINWDASDYSTGMYLLVATNGNYSETKKLMLVK